MKGYKFIEHTADVGIEIYGDSLINLLENATIAFFDAFVFLDKIKESKSIDIVVKADSEDYLLYKWLNELLYLLNVEYFAAKNVKVEINDLTAKGRLKGDSVYPEIIKTEPKAITFHKFKVEKKNDKWFAFVIIDI